MRKNTYIILLIAVIGLFMASCDRKTDENGDLDGMWQLTEWRDKATGEVVATNESGIYYCVQLKLIKFQLGGDGSYYPLSHFTRTPDELIIGKTVVWPSNEERGFEVLADFGVPANGRFHIDALSGSRMQLSSESAVLLFRKY